MDILKKRFEAYAAGTSSGAELRAAVADALRADPESAATCMNLAAQYFRGAAADQGLRDSILADIAALLAMHDPTAVLPPAKMAAPPIDSLTMLRSPRRSVPAAAVFIVPRQLESNRAHQRAATIAASSPDAMPAELAKLKGEPISFRDRVLLDDSARKATLAYYQAQVAELTTPPRLGRSGGR